jgi:hypothetical protein
MPAAAARPSLCAGCSVLPTTSAWSPSLPRLLRRARCPLGCGARLGAQDPGSNPRMPSASGICEKGTRSFDG